MFSTLLCKIVHWFMNFSCEDLFHIQIENMHLNFTASVKARLYSELYMFFYCVLYFF